MLKGLGCSIGNAISRIAKECRPDQNNALHNWIYGVDRLSGNEAQDRRVFAEK